MESRKHTNRIYELRTKLGWSQEQLAKATNTTNQQIGRLEKGQRQLTQTWLNRFARVFGCDPADILPASSRQTRPSSADHRQTSQLSEPAAPFTSAHSSQSSPSRDIAKQDRIFLARAVSLLHKKYPGFDDLSPGQQDQLIEETYQVLLKSEHLFGKGQDVLDLLEQDPRKARPPRKRVAHK